MVQEEIDTGPWAEPWETIPNTTQGGENWDGRLQAPAPPVPRRPALLWPPAISQAPQLPPAPGSFCCGCDPVLGVVSFLGPGCT